MENKKWDYKEAGVDVTAGYMAVKLMQQYVKSTATKGVMGGLGSFGGMFALPEGYKKPVLVSGTDGVGTKLKLAFSTGVSDSIGIDCVAMCANDIVCQGATPLFFLDYIGTGVLEPEVAANIVKGISEGCIQAGCALIGGETAEMPGFYKKGEYDLAGFCVGIAEHDDIINGAKIKEGDTLIGIASSGVHSNGFSLVNKLIEYKNLDINEHYDALGGKLGEALLTPTKIYVSLILELIKAHKIKGIGHITGGGWIENIPRIFASDDLKAVVDTKAIPLPPIFGLIKEWGNMEDSAMYNTFNMGMGMILAVDKRDAESVLNSIKALGEEGYVVGEVKARASEEASVEFI